MLGMSHEMVPWEETYLAYEVQRLSNPIPISFPCVREQVLVERKAVFPGRMTKESAIVSCERWL